MTEHSMSARSIDIMNRRQFVQIGATLTVASVAVRARASEALPALPTDNAQAQALKYTEDAAGSDAPAGQDCTNCLHYKDLDGTWGTCALFPSHRVRGAGWCSAWVKQP
jgi:hypothetical protein